MVGNPEDRFSCITAQIMETVTVWHKYTTAKGCSTIHKTANHLIISRLFDLYKAMS